MTTTATLKTASQFLDRTALRRAYRAEEEACVAERLEQASAARKVAGEAAEFAIQLIEGARAHKASGIDAFLQQYGLDTEEGIALMCLAEALLRVPDDETADLLIRDKIGEIDWGEHLGESSSTFVNAATFSLMLTDEVLDPPEAHQRGMGKTLRKTMNRLGARRPCRRCASSAGSSSMAATFARRSNGRSPSAPGASPIPSTCSAKRR